MKRIFLFFICVLIAFTTNAKRKYKDDSIVTLVTEGEGSTKSTALTEALKTATMQAFGAFVSTNTTVLNDSLVKDEMVTISSGNIAGYKELMAAKLENGNYSVTVEAQVSIKNLTVFAKSKGSSCELDGNTIVQRVKLNKLNRENAKTALENLYRQLKTMLPLCYNPKIEVSPMSKEVDSKTEYAMDVTVKLVPNKSEISSVLEIVDKTLTAIEPKNTEGITTYSFCIAGIGDYAEMFRVISHYRFKHFRSYEKDVCENFISLMSEAFSFYKIYDNLGNEFLIDNFYRLDINSRNKRGRKAKNQIFADDVLVHGRINHPKFFTLLRELAEQKTHSSYTWEENGLYFGVYAPSDIYHDPDEGYLWQRENPGFHFYYDPIVRFVISYTEEEMESFKSLDVERDEDLRNRMLLNKELENFLR